MGTLDNVPGTGSAPYVLGPLGVAVLLGALVLVVRWATGRGGSVAKPPRPQYGLLQPIAAAWVAADLEPALRALRVAGIRCTVSDAGDRHEVLVWPEDANRARSLVRRVIGSS